jgi:hypothetical protein
VFEMTFNVPVVDIYTPVYAWDTTTLFVTGNVVFPLFGNFVFPLFYFAARGCARFSFLGIFAFAFAFVRPSWTDVSSIHA